MTSRLQGALEMVPAGAGLAADLSAGDGESSRLLAARGWRVVSTELQPTAAGWVAADLSCHFPFRDSSFDLALMLEVIEHLENISHALAELGRILKPGGWAIITTPNRLNLSSRVHYLLSGFYKGRRAPLSYRYRVSDGRNWHVMGFNDLHWLAYGQGLRMEAVGRSRRKLRCRLYGAVFYLPILLFSYLLYGKGGRDPLQAPINRELYRFMTSAHVLMDENLVMRLRKVGEGAPAAARRTAGA